MKHLHKFPYAFKIPIEASECICLSVILIVSVIKDIKMLKYITDDVEMSSDESSEEDSDRNLVIKKILLKKILMLSLKRPILEKQFEKMFGDIL